MLETTCNLNKTGYASDLGKMLGKLYLKMETETQNCYFAQQKKQVNTFQQNQVNVKKNLIFYSFFLLK